MYADKVLGGDVQLEVGIGRYLIGKDKTTIVVCTVRVKPRPGIDSQIDLAIGGGVGGLVTGQ